MASIFQYKTPDLKGRNAGLTYNVNWSSFCDNLYTNIFIILIFEREFKMWGKRGGVILQFTWQPQFNFMAKSTTLERVMYL